MSDTERTMLDLLTRRYTAIRDYTIADRWVRAEYVASTLGYGQVKRVADFIAADRYPGDPRGSRLAFHGHEVKVSRSDWLRELRDPTKTDPFLPYMHHWWLVVPTTDIVRGDELPEGWGLLVKSGATLRARVKAERREPLPPPTDLIISLMAAAARTAHRDPFHRDSPTVRAANTGHPSCGYCGHPAPCSVHQPRATAEHNHTRAHE